MTKAREPAWELLYQLKHKTSLKTLQQLQTDIIILDYARPLLVLIKRAFNPPEHSDALLSQWSNKDSLNKINDLQSRFKAMKLRAGHALANKMGSLDNELDEILTAKINCTWLHVKKSTFDEGPQIICYPCVVEDALFTNTPIDPTPFDETYLETEDNFHIENNNSPSLFPIPETEEEMVIEIVSTSSLHD